jgi:hypothetical protein
MSRPETPNQRVTQKELAAALGVTSAAITKARGIGRVERGDDGLYDLAESVGSFRESRTGGTPPPATAPPPGPPPPRAPASRPPPIVRPKPEEPSTLLDFKTLQTQELWLKARLERQQRQGELVERGAVDGEWQSIAVRVRDAMLQIPYTMAPQLAAETEPRAVRDLLRVAIEQALTRLCAALEEEADAEEVEADLEDDDDTGDEFQAGIEGAA